MDPNSIFHLSSTSEFDALTLEVFKFQYRHNLVYREFCNHLGKTPDNTTIVKDIPFLPIEFFKSKKVITGTEKHQAIFTSSGTTGSEVSKHFVQDISLYEKSYLNAFKLFYGDIEEYCVLALLPSYLEREGSSLIYMAEDLIGKSKHPDSGFYLNNIEQLRETLKLLNQQNTKILLLGVSFALLDMAEEAPMALQNTIVMETGGMKGRKKEMIREELHALLKKGFGVPYIHSEYGMTELLSQAYSKGDGRFFAPNWMKVLIRETEDPLSLQEPGKTGGVNIIDLANLYSCSFIATQDLGKTHADGSFEILGRFDHSDVRGCNLMLL
ncbi:Acyl-protein synthetase, LuxE [Arenibacter nanhaiticus]|uniref:Acyl-protein synthetase, LuxE n=1 Tax=Arenibacter nanhaiticus TaxID=558155 RepID=A0A1M6I7C4_9FLAO|nr:acyl transferase [Arenibacter nanhaiticus]SHJ30367.1 Acyl-protein synthetase, LuxE [Arenibacter nanhaiticus]